MTLIVSVWLLFTLLPSLPIEEVRAYLIFYHIVSAFSAYFLLIK